jgi:Na+-driven multidrug efflux pump
MASKTKDMSQGSPMKLIIGFAVPMLFGMLFQQFYNLVDTMIVGKTLGVDALAGVGATSGINFMIIGFCMGICTDFQFLLHNSLVRKNMRSCEDMFIIHMC